MMITGKNIISKDLCGKSKKVDRKEVTWYQERKRLAFKLEKKKDYKQVKGSGSSIIVFSVKKLPQKQLIIRTLQTSTNKRE